jgi:signal transduction histidine kinase/ligand-binding sensor domain-containing protein
VNIINRCALSFALFFCALLALPVRAEQLPVKTYTIADGLAHDEIRKIFQDSHGFLWFCTSDGLSRFDGSGFTTYTVKDGLAFSYLTDMLESRRGVYWIATNGGGISRFDPSATERGGSLFTNYLLSDETANKVDILFEDHAGNIWAGTDNGLFRLNGGDINGKFERVWLNVPLESAQILEIEDIVEDDTGSLWLGCSQGLVRLLPDGRAVHYPFLPQAVDYVWALLKDRDGRIWAGHQSGLLVFKPAPATEDKTDDSFSKLIQSEKQTGTVSSQLTRQSLPQSAGESRWYTSANGLPNNNVHALFQSADGHIWIGTRGGGLSVLGDERLRNYAAAQGLSDRISALAEDHDGNLWVGTQTSGAKKIARSGLLSYGLTEGLGTPEIISIFEDQAGELIAVSTKWTLNRFDGERFTALRPNLPQSITEGSSGRWVIIQDHLGEWWVATSQGLYRFPKVNRLEELARALPVATYTVRDGLADDYISRLFEDSRGDIWISSFHPPVTITRWERATNTLHRYSETDGLPPMNWPNVMAEDRAGNVWFGMHNGGLVRYHGNRFEFFGANEGVPVGLTQGLYFDREGRLWIAVRGRGTGRIDDPASSAPRAQPFVAADKLSSENLWSFTEDHWGFIYIGTERGVDKLNAVTGQVKYFTTADGLIRNQVNTAFRDQRGALWFGTPEGLSRLLPEPDQPTKPPTVLISGLRIAGISQPISELGASALPQLELNPDQNQLQIEFFSIALGAGEAIRYQFMLEGADKDWSQPTTQRVVNYARLAPGNYRFLVRAVSSDGVMSEVPAEIRFKILPPIWQRWWFISLAALFVALAVFSLDRYRVRRMRELDAALNKSRLLADELTVQGAELKKANRTLELEYEVTNILAEATAPAEAAPKILETICRVINWEVGVIWNVDEVTGRLRCQEVWPPHSVNDDALSSRVIHHTFGKWQGLPGRVWASGAAQWTTEPSNETNINSIADRSQEELKSAFGFPITLEGEVVGVLQFFSKERRERDSELLEMMSNVGAQIGQLIERKQAEEALQRAREERLRELERVRTRIATDLHDDIGSSLTQIVILSEVAQQRLNGNDEPLAEPLAKITNVSNELVEAMSDIVWAINPKKDHLSDLVQRMRRFASDIFSACQIHFSLRAPQTEGDVQLGANVRRELFLIFKESVNNIAKHSGCTEAQIEFYSEAGSLVLKLSDNGKGFDVETVSAGTRYSKGGNGLVSMKRRAEDLGGSFEINSGPGEGTRTTLRVPLGQATSFESPHPNGR